MTLYCVVCGAYTLTPAEELDARDRLASHERTKGIQCYRCNREAWILEDPRRCRIRSLEADQEPEPCEPNPRERGDDDGIEYADPRDARDERL